jgi:hypothetical protein
MSVEDLNPLIYPPVERISQAEFWLVTPEFFLVKNILYYAVH